MLNRLPVRLAVPLLLALFAVEAKAEGVPERSSEQIEATQTPAARALRSGHEGLSLYAQGEFSRAFEAFSTAESLVHSPVFLLYQARTARKLGKLLLARELLQKCSNEMILSSSPPAWLNAVEDAALELDAVNEVLPQLTLQFPDDTKYPVEVVGAEQDWTILEPRTTLFVDPGNYDLFASEARGYEARQSLSVKGESARVTVEFAWPKRAGAITSATPSVSVDPERSARPRGRRFFYPAVAAWGAGAAAWVFAGVSFGVATNRAKTLLDGCEDRVCPYSSRFEQYEARQWANLATAGVLVGAVGIAAGTTLFFLEESEHGEWSLGLSATGVEVGGRF